MQIHITLFDMGFLEPSVVERGAGGAGGDEATPIFYLSSLLAFAGRQFKMRLKRG